MNMCYFIFPSIADPHFDCLQFLGIMNKDAMAFVHTYTNVSNHAFFMVYN